LNTSGGIVRHRSVAQYLQARAANGASFSPDGETIAFLTDITGVPQVWTVPAAGGWPDQRTFSSERVAGVQYAPQGDRLLFQMDTGGDERVQLYVLEQNGTRLIVLTEAPTVIHQFGGWSPDGQKVVYANNARQGAYFDLYVRDPAEDQGKRVLEHDGTNNAGPWRPDGGAVLFTRSFTTMHNQLLILDLGTGAAHPLTDAAQLARYDQPAWSADGSAVYVLSDLGRETMALARIDVQSGKLEWLRTGDWDLTHLSLSHDGQRIALVENVDGYSVLHVSEVDGLKALPVPTLPPGVILDLTWRPDGNALAVVISGATRNPDLWLVPVAGEESRRVTQSALAGIPADSLVEPELIRYPTFDKREIPAFYFRPIGASDDCPVVVYVHGGPESQFLPNFNPVVQYLVHRGYAVLATNVRGSTGYGKAYHRLDDVELRMDSVADLSHAVTWLRGRPGGENRRVAVMGGSYGGFMVLSAITTYPELWSAAVDIVGIANFVTFLEHTGPWRRKLRESEYGSLEHDRAFLERISPIHHIDQIKAPIIVIHGANDPRVPIGEAEQIVAVLNERNHPVEYLRFEDEGHGLIKLPNRIQGYTAIAEFLDRWMLPTA
jgi:dipeptidyl aminopeptidase/acylaminoacyl peptidase